MRAKTPWILSGLLAIALAVATVFAIWPAVGDTPWEQEVSRVPTAIPTPTVEITPEPKYASAEVIGIVKQSPPYPVGPETAVDAPNAGTEADNLCLRLAKWQLGPNYVGLAVFVAQYQGNGRWHVNATCDSFPASGGSPSPLQANGQSLSVGQWSFLEDSREVIPIQ